MEKLELDDPYEAPSRGPWTRDADALLWEYAGRKTLSGDDLKRFWECLHGVIGNAADNYRLVLESDGAMLVPKAGQ